VKPKYNHLYALGFSVDSDDREGATEGEILAALSERLQELRHTGEALEAVGVPEEILDNRTGWAVDTMPPPGLRLMADVIGRPESPG
jgi:hypothetical protein